MSGAADGVTMFAARVEVVPRVEQGIYFGGAISQEEFAAVGRVAQRLARELRVRILAYPVHDIAFHVGVYGITMLTRVTVPDRDAPATLLRLTFRHDVIESGCVRHAEERTYEHALERVRAGLHDVLAHELDECLYVAGARRWERHPVYVVEAAFPG